MVSDETFSLSPFEYVCGSVQEICVHLPLLFNSELHHTALFVCSSGETRIKSSTLNEITVLHSPTRKYKTMHVHTVKNR